MQYKCMRKQITNFVLFCIIKCNPLLIALFKFLKSLAYIFEVIIKWFVFLIVGTHDGGLE